jgi:hypothetical protein
MYVASEVCGAFSNSFQDIQSVVVGFMLCQSDREPHPKIYIDHYPLIHVIGAMELIIA